MPVVAVEDLRVGDRFMLPQYSWRIAQIYRVELGDDRVSIYCYGVDYVLHYGTSCRRVAVDAATSPDGVDNT